MNLKFIGWNLILLLFVLYLSVSLFGILALTFSEVENGIVVHRSVVFVLINFVLNLLLSVGLFRYVYKKKIIKKLFWKLLLPVIVLWGMLQAYNTLYRADDIFEGLVIVFIFGIPSVLAYIALYTYAFRER